eukprot:NODE_23_length_42016_cov_0.755803.p32 type:complete len:130 gc:universal NODE_23_length_42016_cov_0.755803:10155-9766(-)
MDELNHKLEEMIQQGTSQMSKKTEGEDQVNVKNVNTIKNETKKEIRFEMKSRRKRRYTTTIDTYQPRRQRNYAIMTLPSGLFLVSIIMVYLYPYTFMGLFGVFVCLLFGFKYFLTWLNELTDEIIKSLK